MSKLKKIPLSIPEFNEQPSSKLQDLEKKISEFEKEKEVMD